MTDTTETPTAIPEYTQQETDEGTALMKLFMDTWKARVEAQSERGDGEGVSEEVQVRELVACAKEFGGRFEESRWVKGLMERF